MGAGTSKNRLLMAKAVEQAKLDKIPRMEVPLTYVFGPKKGQTVTLKFRALRQPETSTDAEFRVHGALTTAGLPATESSVQKLVDKLLAFTRANTDYDPPANECRRRPTVAQALVGSAARAIFVQYDADRSNSIDAEELAAMMAHVQQARAQARGDETSPELAAKTVHVGMAGAQRIIAALDTDQSGCLEEDEFCDAIVRSFGWSLETRIKNIHKLAKGDPEVIEFFDSFFDGVRFCVGHIIQRTSAAIVERCLNPPDELAKSEAALASAEKVVQQASA